MEQWKNMNKAVGLKQSKKALLSGEAKTLVLAKDADPMLIEPLRALAEEKSIPVLDQYSMSQIGKAAGITVGAAAVVLL